MRLEITNFFALLGAGTLLLLGMSAACAEKVKHEAIACRFKQTLNFLDRQKKEGGEKELKGVLRFALADGNCIVLSPGDRYKRLSAPDRDGFVRIRDCCTGRIRWMRSVISKSP